MLEQELRAKLDEMEKKIWSTTPDQVELIRNGYNMALGDINAWLDSRSDGWHNLRENPEIPAHFQKDKYEGA